MVILNETKEKINKTITFEANCTCSRLTTLEQRVPQLVEMGKEEGHADNDYSIVSKAVCKISSMSECRATQGTPASSQQ